MIVLLDTNVLLRLDHVGNPHREVAREAIERLFDDQHQPRIVPQVLYEYWVVATRPAESNGLGFSIQDAQRMLADLKELFAPFRDERGILERWEELITRHECRGKVAHDARLVAAMVRHQITHLMTFNVQDFSRFDEMTAVSPEAVATGSYSF